MILFCQIKLYIDRHVKDHKFEFNLSFFTVIRNFITNSSMTHL